MPHFVLLPLHFGVECTTHHIFGFWTSSLGKMPMSFNELVMIYSREGR